MRCPICESQSKVYDKKERNRLWRRRKCKECYYRFTSYELTAEEIIEMFEEELTLEELQKITTILEREMPALKKIKEDVI